MNVLFDKDTYEKGASVQGEMNSNAISEKLTESDMMEGKIVKRALLDSVTTGKIGSLNVDPNFLDFQPLECKYIAVKII